MTTRHTVLQIKPQQTRKAGEARSISDLELISKQAWAQGFSARTLEQQSTGKHKVSRAHYTVGVILLAAAGKARAKACASRGLKFTLGSASMRRCVVKDYDDCVKWFSESEEESVELLEPDDRMLFDLRNRVVALKKAKKVENVKVVSRTERGRLIGLWLVKK